MSLLDLFRRRDRDRAAAPLATRQTISPADLHAALRAQLLGHTAAHCTIRLADTAFASVSESEARGFIAASASYWTAEINDCDDRAWMAKAAAIRAQYRIRQPLAFGVAWTEDHALNWYWSEAGEIRLLDQQERFGRLTPITLILA